MRIIARNSSLASWHHPWAWKGKWKNASATQLSSSQGFPTTRRVAPCYCVSAQISHVGSQSCFNVILLRSIVFRSIPPTPVQPVLRLPQTECPPRFGLLVRLDPGIPFCCFSATAAVLLLLVLLVAARVVLANDTVSSQVPRRRASRLRLRRGRGDAQDALLFAEPAGGIASLRLVLVHGWVLDWVALAGISDSVAIPMRPCRTTFKCRYGKRTPRVGVGPDRRFVVVVCGWPTLRVIEYVMA